MERDLKEKLLWAGKNWLSFGSAMAFCCALGLAFDDKAAGAGVAAGLFLVAALLHVFPRLEYLKAFMIETKFKADLVVATEIIDQMKAASISLAAATSSIAATSPTLTWIERFAMVMPVVDSLRALSIPETEIKRSTSIFRQSIEKSLVDGIFMATIRHTQRTEQNLRMKVGEMGEVHGSDSTEAREATEQYQEFTNGRGANRSNLEALFRDFSQENQRVLPNGMNEDDTKSLHSFQIRTAKAYSDFLTDASSRLVLKQVLTAIEVADLGYNAKPEELKTLMFQQVAP